MIVKSKFNAQAKIFEPQRVTKQQTAIDRDGARHSQLLTLEKLPLAVLINVFENLDTLALIVLASTSQYLRHVILDFTIVDKIRALLPKTLHHDKAGLHDDTYRTMKPYFENLSVPTKLQRLEKVHRNQSLGRFSISEEATWSHKAMPVVRADKDKMVLASGNELWYSFAGADWMIEKHGKPGIEDISDISLTDVMDEVIAGFVDGRIERIKMQPRNAGRASRQTRIVSRYRGKSNAAVQAIDYDSVEATLLAVTQDGRIKVNQEEAQLHARPWCTAFINSQRLVTGTLSSKPLLIHEVSNSGIHLNRSYGNDQYTRTSVFAAVGITANLVVSGWYDHTAQLHDLRCASDKAVHIWREPWDNAAVYSVAYSGNALYLGSAMNGVLRMHDFRSPKCIRSLFLGQRQEKGPVYSLVAEHERVYGALEHCVRGVDFYRTSETQSHRDDYVGSNFSGNYLDHATWNMVNSLAR